MRRAVEAVEKVASQRRAQRQKEQNIRKAVRDEPWQR
jgi:hypothetical protein